MPYSLTTKKQPNKGAKQEVVKGEAKNQQFNNTNVDYTSNRKKYRRKKGINLEARPKGRYIICR